VTLRCLAIVPAHNEADVIARTIGEIRAEAPAFDVLVVDDGSSDATAVRAAPHARVLRLPFNLGVGGAVQAGYMHALEQGYDIAVQVDADGQHDPREIPAMLARLQAEDRVNMVVGSRFLEASANGFRSSRPRRAGIRLFARLLSRLSRQRVTDPTSGFRMVDRKGIELFARDYPVDYPEVEAILLMHYNRLRSCEVPSRMRPRTHGRSTIGSARSVYYMAKVLLAVLIGTLRARTVALDPAVAE
jgi:glycosyltransferase involved in cell wall biosynthesis